MTINQPHLRLSRASLKSPSQWSRCRCTQCATFTARIRKVSLAHERCQLEHAQSVHIKNVRHMRMIQSRLNALSEASTSTQGDGSLSSGILKVDCDGLDQSKTKYPRNLDSSKSLASLWRPQIHMLCCVVWGDSWIQFQQRYWITVNLNPMTLTIIHQKIYL